MKRILLAIALVLGAVLMTGCPDVDTPISSSLDGVNNYPAAQP